MSEIKVKRGTVCWDYWKVSNLINDQSGRN